MSKDDFTVVTYEQANGHKATTTVTPAQKAELESRGRLVQDHGRDGSK
jgi:hypothetical protein